MAHVVVQNFDAAKELIKRGSLSADDKAILGSYPQETYHHKDSPVSKQDHGQFLDSTYKCCHTHIYTNTYIYVVTQGGQDQYKEGEFNLLFYAIKTRNHDAFEVVLPKSDVLWQNSIGMLFSRRPKNIVHLSMISKIMCEICYNQYTCKFSPELLI